MRALLIALLAASCAAVGAREAGRELQLRTAPSTLVMPCAQWSQMVEAWAYVPHDRRAEVLMRIRQRSQYHYLFARDALQFLEHSEGPLYYKALEACGEMRAL